MLNISCGFKDNLFLPTIMFQFAIDRGGTFTDVWARCPSGKICVLKLLSDDPSNYPDAPREAIKRILQVVFRYCFVNTLQYGIYVM